MKDTAFVYTFGEAHFLDGHFPWTLKVGCASVDNSICTGTDLFPTVIVTQICEASAEQLQESLACEKGLDAAHSFS